MAKHNTEHEMSFLEHLEELRWHILRALGGTFVIAVILLFSKKFVFDTLIFGPANKDFITYKLLCKIKICLSPPTPHIYQRLMGEEFVTHLKVSFLLGLIVAFPYVFWEIWQFIKPGLYPKEQKAARGIVAICSMLFLLGVFFGYFIIAPFAITFLLNYSISNLVAGTDVTLGSWINYMVMFTLPTGLVFELPIIMYFLSKAGLVYPDLLRKFRKHAVVAILIVAAIVTPPDVMTQILISIPLYALYEVSIIISARVDKNRKKEELEAEAESAVSK